MPVPTAHLRATLEQLVRILTRELTRLRQAHIHHQAHTRHRDRILLPRAEAVEAAEFPISHRGAEVDRGRSRFAKSESLKRRLNTIC